MALIADDESGIGWKCSFIDVGCVGRSFDCDYFFICRDEFPKVVFFGEMPFYVVFAGSGAFSNSTETVDWFRAKKYHFGSADIVGEAYHRAHVVGGDEAVG